jgi:nucleoside-diphosphate-sugar epimerase
MRVLVAGATGALGIPVVRQLVDEGHDVVGLARTARRTPRLEALGARAVVADALDATALRDAVLPARPDVVVHALTAIPSRGPLRASDLDATNRLRVSGTKNLLSASIHAGVRRIIVESMVFIYGFGDLGDAPLTEGMAPARMIPDPSLRPPVEALMAEERQVLDASRAGSIEGLILRFGGLYGPGAGIDVMMSRLRRRLLPLPKRPRSRGVPWVHVRDASSAVVAAVSRGGSGQLYNIADDEPTPAREFIEHLARAIRAPKPLSVPDWILRLAVPLVASAWFDTTLIVSNQKAKRELGWVPRFPTYRDGIDDTVRSHATSEAQRDGSTPDDPRNAVTFCAGLMAWERNMLPAVA